MNSSGSSLLLNSRTSTLISLRLVWLLLPLLRGLIHSSSLEEPRQFPFFLSFPPGKFGGFRRWRVPDGFSPLLHGISKLASQIGILIPLFFILDPHFFIILYEGLKHFFQPHASTHDFSWMQTGLFVAICVWARLVFRLCYLAKEKPRL